jgi:antitoxin PrlF
MQIKNENRGLISSSGQFTSTLSQKGQVKIPAKIRDYIDAKAGDQIQFVIEGDNVFVNVVKKKKNSLLALFGAMPPKAGEPNLSWEEIRRGAKEEMISSE